MKMTAHPTTVPTEGFNFPVTGSGIHTNRSNAVAGSNPEQALTCAGREMRGKCAPTMQEAQNVDMRDRDGHGEDVTAGETAHFDTSSRPAIRESGSECVGRLIRKGRSLNQPRGRKAEYTEHALAGCTSGIRMTSGRDRNFLQCRHIPKCPNDCDSGE